MDRDTEYLRQQIDYLERMLENCLSHISSLEARVAELERRPVALPPAEEATERSRDRRTRFVEEWAEVVESTEAHRLVFVSNRKGPRSGRR